MRRRRAAAVPGSAGAGRRSAWRIAGAGRAERPSASAPPAAPRGRDRDQRRGGRRTRAGPRSARSRPPGRLRRRPRPAIGDRAPGAAQGPQQHQQRPADHHRAERATAARPPACAAGRVSAAAVADQPEQRRTRDARPQVAGAPGRPSGRGEHHQHDGDARRAAPACPRCPACATANSLTGVGVASTSTPPTATTVPACGRPSSAATSSATAAPAATASTPASRGRAQRRMTSSGHARARRIPRRAPWLGACGQLLRHQHGVDDVDGGVLGLHVAADDRRVAVHREVGAAAGDRQVAALAASCAMPASCVGRQPTRARRGR